MKPLSEDDAVSLCRPINAEEIRESMFSIGNEKAPGPDGYNACFFKSSWCIVGSDVTTAVMEYFSTSFILPGFNSTSLVLVPKKKCPYTIVDFRPIACCQVFYKCITKILANRLNLIMPSIISKS